MGGQLSKALGKLFGNKEMRILMLGLDAAGKTSAWGDAVSLHPKIPNPASIAMRTMLPDPVQAQVEPERHDDPYSRVQRRDGYV
ncbi:hypothetical protein EHS25_009751 [Saitozyma podzolica]|uniref:Uncharacterized protein n=1 Tax=Saitozyma podzolica TaxID=1890683 RepID=A0A427YK29_9TREE|nr:hypothetical protein EHS25_009751 [Saitozyma podzolica]